METRQLLLIVDDEPSYRRFLRGLLERLGYRTAEAQDGPGALEAALRERPDLVLLDAGLGPMDGFEVCERIQQDATLKGTPVIFISGMLDSSVRVRGLRVGAVDFISKPCPMEEIEARIRLHLELTRQRRELELRNEDLQRILHDAQVLNRKLLEMNERLQYAEDVKSHFVANMRNEINNPLAVIRGMADQILPDGPPSDRCRQCRAMARLIRMEAFNLDFHIQNVFYAAELESGDLKPDFARVQIHSVLRDVVDSLVKHTEGKSVTVDLPEEPSLVFATDAALLHTIFANLLANAIEFSPPGGRVEVRAERTDHGLTVQVADQGPGIPETSRAAVFDRFRQLETGSTRKHQGQGLGLPVAKSLAELLGGQVAFRSEVGAGSTFSVWLPEAALPGEAVTEAFDGNMFLFGEPEEL